MITRLHKLAFSVACSAAILSGPIAHGQAVSSTTTSTTTSAGLISEVGSDALVIRTETSPTPIRYGFTPSTVYLDETGAPVSREVVRSGVPVTVEYVQDGERLVASRVIVRRQTTTTTNPAPTVIERNTTITRPPVVIDRPVVVEKPVIVEKKVPVIVEKKVLVEKPVVVEKRVPAPVIEEKTTKTTTTTTTTDK
ncbi:MAG: hypothetical protein QOE70_6545 [Chthoniobacter sp.]|jgi:hypothetical protein|nr:hypothetical protein [Chthoniobacter sp.]